MGELKDWLNAKDLGGDKSAMGMLFMFIRTILFYGAVGAVFTLILLLILIIL